jgi:hypothetical protein
MKKGGRTSVSKEGKDEERGNEEAEMRGRKKRKDRGEVTGK